ncbi:MAG: sulfatase-like hydrolase/transferase [Akkermansiaceae bacterium]|nr:sulfatase-like hydrolase/transferase [Akkermansiaceae bacterium]
MKNRRNFLKTSALGLMAVASAGSAMLPAAANAAPDRKPNVVIFFTDDQGTLDANCYGSKDLYTPTMDKLAETGVRFTQAYAHFVCCPSRAMLLTGRYPQRSGVNAWTQGNHKVKGGQLNMALEETTIAELLKGAGYKTGMFGKWHLGAHDDFGPTSQGFDEFFGFRSGFIDNYIHNFLHEGFHDLFDGKTEVFMNGQYFPDLMTGRAVQFVEKNKDDPFFMYVAFNLPHYPEQADAKFDARYKDMAMPRQSYAKVVSTVDDRMGMVLKKLEELGLRDDTIVIFMSDNGASVEDCSINRDNHPSGFPKGHHYGPFGGGGNSGKWRGAKATYFEGGVRVPAIISYPSKLPKGVVRDQAITAMDWLPTIADLCGVPLPKVKLDGQSIMPIITAADAPTHNQVLHWHFEHRWAVRQGDWKLISSHKGEPDFLANLADEEPERKNHLKENPEIAQRLLQLHKEWTREVMSKEWLKRLETGR